MRDKAKLSWKEARQEADTCPLVISTTDGDSVVEEVVKTPVWMTAVEEPSGVPAVRDSSSFETFHSTLPDIHRRSGAQSTNSLPSNSRSRPQNAPTSKKTSVSVSPNLNLGHNRYSCLSDHFN